MFPTGRHASQTNWFVQISWRARARQLLTRSLGFRQLATGQCVCLSFVIYSPLHPTLTVELFYVPRFSPHMIVVVFLLSLFFSSTCGSVRESSDSFLLHILETVIELANGDRSRIPARLFSLLLPPPPLHKI